jgi:hypothetical protein
MQETDDRDLDEVGGPEIEGNDSSQKLWAWKSPRIVDRLLGGGVLQKGRSQE